MDQHSMLSRLWAKQKLTSETCFADYCLPEMNDQSFLYLHLNSPFEELKIGILVRPGLVSLYHYFVMPSRFCVAKRELV
jgi:hypothetical protein